MEPGGVVENGPSKPFVLPREPAPAQDEYFLPKNQTAPKVPLGKFPKDTGKTSSRLADIEKQAKKTPGPGRYLKINEWKGQNTFKFSKANRFVGDAEMMVKKRGHQPGPGHYESKEVNLKPANAVRSNLSDISRVVLGRVPKSKKETYIDRLCRPGGVVSPSSQKYAAITAAAVCRNRLELHTTSLPWTKTVTQSRKDPKGAPPSLAPNHYRNNYKLQESRSLDTTFPKEKTTNFIDKQTKAKSFCPAPGTYPLIKLEKISRATKYCQVNNIGRSTLSGLF